MLSLRHQYCLLCNPENSNIIFTVIMRQTFLLSSLCIQPQQQHAESQAHIRVSFPKTTRPCSFAALGPWHLSHQEGYLCGRGCWRQALNFSLDFAALVNYWVDGAAHSWLTALLALGRKTNQDVALMRDSLQPPALLKDKYKISQDWTSRVAGDNGVLACWHGFRVKTSPCGFVQGREGKIKGTISFCKLTSELGSFRAIQSLSNPSKCYATPTQAMILFLNVMKWFVEKMNSWGEWGALVTCEGSVMLGAWKAMCIFC